MAAPGSADLSTGTPLQASDRFRVASVTKTFTATLVLMLKDGGRLLLDDSVEKHVPGVPGGQGITLRQLLNHTSGLHEYTDDPLFLQASNADPYRDWQPIRFELLLFTARPY